MRQASAAVPSAENGKDLFTADDRAEESTFASSARFLYAAYCGHGCPVSYLTRNLIVVEYVTVLGPPENQPLPL